MPQKLDALQKVCAGLRLRPYDVPGNVTREFGQLEWQGPIHVLQNDLGP